MPDLRAVQVYPLLASSRHYISNVISGTINGAPSPLQNLDEFNGQQRRGSLYSRVANLPISHFAVAAQPRISFVIPRACPRIASEFTPHELLQNSHRTNCFRIHTVKDSFQFRTKLALAIQLFCVTPGTKKLSPQKGLSSNLANSLTS